MFRIVPAAPLPTVIAAPPTRPSSASLPRVVLAALLPLVLLSGCTGLAQPAPPVPATQSAEPPDGADPSTTESDGADSETAAESGQSPSATPTPPTTEAPLATRAATYQGGRLELDLYPLHRDGKVTTLTARLRVLSWSDDVGPVDSQFVLSDSWELERDGGTPTDGFQLVDERSGTAYLPAERQLPAAKANTAVCTTIGQDFVVGDEIWVSCLFGSPPPELDRVTVQVKTFGAFTNVPLR